MDQSEILTKQMELSRARKQVQGKSSLVIIREQVASIWGLVNNLVGEVRLLRLAVEGSHNMRAHQADQRLIQEQAATILKLREDLDDAQGIE